MIFVEPSGWPDHSILSPSTAHIWSRKDPEQLAAWHEAQLAKERGTKMHEFAAKAIKTPLRLPKNSREIRDLIWLHSGYQFPISQNQIDTVRDYVNDAIGFGLTVEQKLGFGDPTISSGTTDAISFRDDFLRVHDLKTGVQPPHMEQLLAYAALACLQYKIKPFEIQTELRFYYNAEIIVHNPEPDEISRFMDIYLTDAEILKKRKIKGA